MIDDAVVLMFFILFHSNMNKYVIVDLIIMRKKIQNKVCTILVHFFDNNFDRQKHLFSYIL